MPYGILSIGLYLCHRREGPRAAALNKAPFCPQQFTAASNYASLACMVMLDHVSIRQRKQLKTHLALLYSSSLDGFVLSGEANKGLFSMPSSATRFASRSVGPFSHTTTPARGGRRVCVCVCVCACAYMYA